MQEESRAVPGGCADDGVEGVGSAIGIVYGKLCAGGPVASVVDAEAVAAAFQCQRVVDDAVACPAEDTYLQLLNGCYPNASDEVLARVLVGEIDALTGEDIILSAQGYDAVVLQHEYDHLDGKFYYDRINPMAPNTKIPGEEII